MVLVVPLGCFEDTRKAYINMLMFAGLLVITLILESAIGIATTVSRFDKALNESLEKSMDSYIYSNNSEVCWNYREQKLMMCCGVETLTEWQGQPIPCKCCNIELDQEIDYNVQSVLGWGIGIAFLEVMILGTCWACWHEMGRVDEDLGDFISLD